MLDAMAISAWGRAAFHAFKTQFPHSTQAQETGRARCPFVSPHSGEVEAAFLDMAPSSRIPPMEDFIISQFGCAANM
eukprot:1592735-Alexandrium_andersonii.AAC.1